MAVNVAPQNGDQLEVAATADPMIGEVFWTNGIAATPCRCATVTDLRGQAINGAADGLVATADATTHATLVDIISADAGRARALN